MQIKYILALITPAISAATLPIQDYVEPRSPVSNGKPSAAGKYPYMVAIEKDGHVHCSGTLIDRTAVLTARSCIQPLGNSLTVRAGTTVIHTASPTCCYVVLI